MSTKEQYAPDAGFREPGGDFMESVLTLQELAFLAGTTGEVIAQLVDLDLIAPGAGSETPLFRVEAVGQVRKILRLRRQLQISFDSMALIFDLLERIDALERRVGEMKNE